MGCMRMVVFRLVTPQAPVKWVMLQSTKVDIAGQLVIRGPKVVNQVLLYTGTEELSTVTDLLTACILKLDPLVRPDWDSVENKLPRGVFEGCWDKVQRICV